MRIGQGFRQVNGVAVRQRVISRHDEDQILLGNRDKFNGFFVFQLCAEDHVVFFILQALQKRLCYVCVELELNVLVLLLL